MFTVLTGCAGYQTFRDGQSSLVNGQTEVGLSQLKDAAQQDPQNTEFRRTYFAQREAALNGLLREAESAADAGLFAQARATYEKASRIDGANQRAADGRERVNVIERQWRALDAATALSRDGNVDRAISVVQQVVSETPTNRRAALLLRQLLRQQADVTGKELGIYPKLKEAYRVPVSLSFTNATLLQVFEALKLASGLNYMIERDVKPDLRVTLSVTNKPVEDIVRLLLATNQLDRRVLDGDTLLIYPNTPAKAAEYKEMVVRSFYISNADATKVAEVVRTIAKARDVVVDEKLNMFVVRDSAEVVRLAEKLVSSQDLPDPEVMLQLEVLEVNVSRLLEMGIHWPDTFSAGVVGSDGVAGQLRLDELRNISSSMGRVNISDPAISAQLRSTKGDANLLANPRVRVKNRQSAKILIGERVPVITTIATANVGTSESVSYLDVGLKLEIEPTVSLDDEVSMKIALEVSNVLGTVTTPNGTQAYHLGTRNTSTSLRVKDGETNILAGLIQRDERRSNTGVPGLNEVPILSKLFGAASDSDSRTEIVLLITPQIVRNLDMPGLGQQEFLAGTDSAIGASPIQLGTPDRPAERSPGLNRPANLNGQPSIPKTNLPGNGTSQPGFPRSQQPSGLPSSSPSRSIAPPFSSSGNPTQNSNVIQAPAVPAFTQPGIVPSSPR